MAVSEAEKSTNITTDKSGLLEYDWLYNNIYGRLQTVIQEFFLRDYKLRFMGVSYDDENVLFFGDKYFVNKVPVNDKSSVIVRISSGLISSILDNVLGACENAFSLSNITDIEAELIKSFTLFMYNKLDDLLIKSEPNKKVLKSSKTYNFTFYVQYEEKHEGKIIISFPAYFLKDSIKIEERVNNFDISNFKNTSVSVTLRIGSSRIHLNDIKKLENGDVIVLDDSNTDKMALLWEENLVKFNINPNPSIIIRVDKNGGGEMENISATNNDNMWDSIPVDVTAEFDNFRLTLGELRQISEGLVIDVGSVYNNKIKLRVAKQVIASGELVILNDRYGVRIDSINDSSDIDNEEEEEEIEETMSEVSEERNKTKSGKPIAADSQDADESEADDDKNFNYSDFEIEDESI